VKIGNSPPDWRPQTVFPALAPFATLLRITAESGERDPGGRGRIELRPATQLADLGVTKTQSARWQKLARLDEAAFEKRVTDARALGARGQ
jgi:hypothetical protein